MKTPWLELLGLFALMALIMFGFVGIFVVILSWHVDACERDGKDATYTECVERKR